MIFDGAVRGLFSNLLTHSDHHDLDERFAGGRRDADGSARRRVRFDDFAVDVIHCREVPGISKPHDGIHDIGERHLVAG